MLMAPSFIFYLSDCHKALRTLGTLSLMTSLRWNLAKRAGAKSSSEGKYTKCHKLFDDIFIQKLKRLSPLSGLGLFTIERNTITSMISVAVTYIIIFIQFKITVESK